jgi:hypothetical protein
MAVAISVASLSAAGTVAAAFSFRSREAAQILRSRHTARCVGRINCLDLRRSVDAHVLLLVLILRDDLSHDIELPVTSLFVICERAVSDISKARGKYKTLASKFIMVERGSMVLQSAVEIFELLKDFEPPL